MITFDVPLPASLPWDEVRRKLDELAAPVTTAAQRDAIAQAVANLEAVRVRDLTALLGAIGPAGP